MIKSIVNDIHLVNNININLYPEQNIYLYLDLSWSRCGFLSWYGYSFNLNIDIVFIKIFF